MKSEHRTVVIKSFLVGTAAWYLARGVRFRDSAVYLGASVAGVNAVSCAVFGQATQRSWVIPESTLSVSWERIKVRVNEVSTKQCFGGLLVLYGIHALSQNQLQYLQKAFGRGGLSALKAFGNTVVLAPIAEEIFHRGFVLEWLENAQGYHKGSAPPSFIHGQQVRLWAHALIYGLSHYHPNQGGLANPLIMIATGLLGHELGTLKELCGIHTSLLLHGMINGLVATRAFVTGG